MNANISLQGTLYPNLVHVCNPFSAPPEYQYQPDNCPANTIRIGDIPKVCQLRLKETTLMLSFIDNYLYICKIICIILFWQALKLLTCSDANNGTCESGQYVSNADYKTVEAYSSSIQNLLNAYPGIESLIECQSVKDAFSEILLKHCKPLKRYVKMVWVSMLILSLIMAFLVLTWITKAHHDQNHHFSDASVKPHLATANMLETGAAKEVNSHTNSSIV